MSSFNFDIAKLLAARSNDNINKLNQYEFINEAYKAANDCELDIQGHLQDTGNIVRVGTKRKPHKKNGAYIYNSTDQFFYAHNFDAELTKKIWGNNVERTAQQQRVQREIASARLEQEKQKNLHAAIEVHRWMSQSTPIETHPYIELKQITPFGSLLFNGQILVPIFSESGDISSCQLIAGNGQKRFKYGGRIKGGRYLIGKLDSTQTILICEGYATACSLHKATHLPVVIVFSASNFAEVCTSIRRKHPSHRLVICSDNDHIKQAKTGINTGLDAAKLAAKKSGAMLITPQFAANDCGTDFNDIHCRFGIASLTNLLANELREVTCLSI